MFTHSYFTLASRLQIADGRDLARGDYPPYTIGSAASPLMEKIDGSHHDVRLSDRELRMVKLWIDASATFPGTYAALGSGMIGSYAADSIRHEAAAGLLELAGPKQGAGRDASAGAHPVTPTLEVCPRRRRTIGDCGCITWSTARAVRGTGRLLGWPRIGMTRFASVRSNGCGNTPTRGCSFRGTSCTTSAARRSPCCCWRPCPSRRPVTGSAAPCFPVRKTRTFGRCWPVSAR
jgi:hypothetical protein